MTPGMTWKAVRYPVTLVCGFCGRILTIALRYGGPTTVTSGHAHDCIQNPACTRRPSQGNAA